MFMTFHNLIPLVLGFQNLRKLEICDDLGNLGFADTLDIVAYSLERNGNLKELDITQKFGGERLECRSEVEEAADTIHTILYGIYPRMLQYEALDGVMDSRHYQLNPDTVPMPGAEDDGMDGVVLWELPCVKLLEMKVCAFGGLPLRMSYLDVNTLNNIKEFRLNIKAEFTPDDLRKISINLSCLESLEILEFEHCGVVRRAPVMMWKSRNNVIGSASRRARIEEKEKEVYKDAAKLCALYITLLKKIIWKNVGYIDKSVWQFESYVIRQSERGIDIIQLGFQDRETKLGVPSLTPNQ
ncbi:hypothetical protein TWF751_000114 [Orbilia oligospora]|nr:hypothetical protein TWF751_000114 [Orbilia oligospora]